MSIARFFRGNKTDPHCSAVIVAAGSSERMGTDKLMMEIGGVPALARTLTVFQQCLLVDEIVVVTRMDRVTEIAELCRKYGISKAAKVITGGATRMESALAGVSAVRCGSRLIAIHDGARPLVTAELIERTVKAAAEHLSAVPVIPVTDTLKRVGADGVIVGGVDRTDTVRVQTPQVFDADLIKGALTAAAKENLPITDDCSAIERMGVKTRTVEGDTENIKLTMPEDVTIAEAILKHRGELNAYRAWV